MMMIMLMVIGNKCNDDGIINGDSVGYICGDGGYSDIYERWC